MCQACVKHRTPRGASIDDHIVLLDVVDGDERIHIDHEPVFGQGPAIGRVALPREVLP